MVKTIFVSNSSRVAYIARMRKSSRKHRERRRNRVDVIFVEEAWLETGTCSIFIFVGICPRCVFFYPVYPALRYEGTSVAVQEAGNPKPHGDTTSGLYTVLTFPLKPVCVELLVHDLRRTSGCVTRGVLSNPRNGRER